MCCLIVVSVASRARAPGLIFEVVIFAYHMKMRAYYNLSPGTEMKNALSPPD